MLRYLILCALLACPIVAPSLSEGPSLVPPEQSNPPIANCQRSAPSTTWPTLNGMCADGTTPCITATMVSTLWGYDGRCTPPPPKSCKLNSYMFSVFYAGCGESQPSCCSTDLDVSGVGPPETLALKHTCLVLMGGGEPGCPGLVTTDLVIQCQGTVLLHGQLQQACLGCD